MNIIVSGKHLEEAPEMEAYAIKKVGKLAKFHSKIEKIAVDLVSETSHSDKNTDYFCEIIVDIPGKNLEIRQSNDSMDKAIDKAVERMKRLIVKDKEKHLSRIQKEGLRSKPR